MGIEKKDTVKNTVSVGITIKKK